MKKQYSIYSKTAGVYITDMTKESVVAIYPTSEAFIIFEDKDKGVIFPYEVTAEGGLRRITIKAEASMELKQLRRLRRANELSDI
jgi:hypothetical protein